MIPLSLYCLVAVLVVEQAVLSHAGTATLERLELGAMAALAGTMLVVLALAVASFVRPLRQNGAAVSKGDSGSACSISMKPIRLLRVHGQILGKGLRTTSHRDVWHRLGAAVCAIVACALVGIGSACVVAREGMSAAARLSKGPVSSWDLVVVSDSSLTRTGYRCRCKVREGGSEQGDFWLTGEDAFERGETLRCVGRFKPLENDDWGTSCRAQGVWGTIACVHTLSRKPPSGVVGLMGHLRTLVSDSFDPASSDARAFLDACVTARREALKERGCDELFRTCGVSHLVAVSGGHLAVVSAVLGVVLGVCGLAPLPRLSLLVGISGLFVAFCGAPVSAVRAWIMVAVSSAGQLVGRRSHGLSSVCAVGVAMALASPELSGQLSFVLSVSSVTALCLFSRYASYMLQTLLPSPRLPRKVAKLAGRSWARLWRTGCDALSATLVAQLATTPLTIQAFGDLSLVAPFANLVLGPLFTPFVGLGLLAASLTWLPGAQHVVLMAADLVGNLALAALRLFASLPFVSISVGEGSQMIAVVCVAIMVALLVAWPRANRRLVGEVLGAACTCAALLLVRWRWFAPARICVLDVGQGDAILVQDGGSALLVDAGPEGALAPALLHEHVMHLDALAITHLHDDHYGGMADLPGDVPCERVYVATGARENEPTELRDSIREVTGGDSEELSYGDTLHVGGFELRVVSPRSPSSGKSNADSLVMSVNYQGRNGSLSALLTGDAEEEQLEGVLERHDAGDIDFLKVGHHGSEISISPEEARQLKPEVSVASAGEGNSYGHPREECVTTLERAGSWFLCTKDVGSVEIRPAPDGVRVRCEHVPGSP